MNRISDRIIQGAYPARGLPIALSLALISVFIPLPFLVLAAILLVLAIARCRASPLPEEGWPVHFLRRPCLRSPPA